MIPQMRGSMVQNFLATQGAVDEQGDKLRQDRARLTAGNALKAGDYGAGANALLGAGDLKGGEALRTQGAQITGSKAYAAKDYAGAKEAFAGVGDAENVGRVGGAELADQKTAYEFMQQAAHALEAELDRGGPEAVAAGYDRLAPMFAKIPGATPESIAQTKEALTGPNAKEAFRMLNEHVKAQLQVVNRGNGAYDVVDMTNGRAVRSVAGDGKQEWKERKRADGSTEWFDINNPGAPGQAAPPGASTASGKFEDFWTHYLAPAEGGFAPNDGNGAPVNFGINQGSNPDIDVKSLTSEKAAEIAHDRYWKPSGADTLPPGLAEIQADTAFNMGIPAAKKLLEQSGGDPKAYLAMREQRYRAIAAANPDKAKFLPTWLDRNQKLAEYVGAGAASAPAKGAAIGGDAAPAAEWVDMPGGGQRNTRTGERKDKPASAVAAEAKALDKADKEAAARADMASQSQAIMGAIDEALPQIGPLTAGMIGGNITVKGTSAYNLARNIDTIKAILGFQELQKMRANSPTGGALGAISDREIKFLQSTVASLDTGQSPDQLRANLKKVKQHYAAWADAVTKAGSTPQGASGAPSGKPGRPSLDQIFGGR